MDLIRIRNGGGTVESISPAAAQEFSLLPAQNTSGNWVKVVQRIPMRVRVDTSDKNLQPRSPHGVVPVKGHPSDVDAARVSSVAAFSRAPRKRLVN